MIFGDLRREKGTILPLMPQPPREDRRRRWTRAARAVAPARLAASCLTLALVAGPATGDGRIELLRGLQRAERHAAVDSLATVILADFDRARRPDSLAIAEVLLAQGPARLQLNRPIRETVWPVVELGLGIRTRHLGPGHLETLRARLIVAEQSDGSDWSAVRREVQEILDLLLRHSIRDDTLIATCRVDLGTTEILLGRGAEGLEPLRLAVEERERIFGASHPQARSARMWWIRAMLHAGEFDLAKDRARAELDQVEREGGADSDVREGLLSYLTYAYNQVGDWAGAVATAREAIRFAESSGDTGRILLARHNLATTLMYAEDLRGSREMLEALQDQVRNYPGMDRHLSNGIDLASGGRSALGSIYLGTRDWDTAERLFNEAESLSDRANRATAAVARGNALLGRAQVRVGRKQLRESLELYRQASVVYDSMPGREVESRVAVRTQALHVSLRLRDRARIDSIRTELAGVATPAGASALTMTPLALHWMARADYALGREDSAWAGSLAAEAGIREQNRRSIERLPDARALDIARRKQHVLGQVLWFAGPDRPSRWETAWDRVVRHRGLVGAELDRRRVPPELRADTALVARHSEWMAEQRRYSRQLVLGDRASGGATLAERRSAAEGAELAYVQALRGRAPAPLPEVGAEAIRAALPPGSALVSFAEFEDLDDVRRMTAFVVRAGAPGITRVEFGRTDSLAERVAAWRERIAEPPPLDRGPARRAEAECRRHGERVREALWDPLGPLVSGASRVFLVPDGPVTDLAFFALPIGRDGYLAERGPELTMIHAERELVRHRAEAATRSLLAVGDPEFSKPTPEGRRPPEREWLAAGPLHRSIDPCADSLPARFASLPGTRNEVSAIVSRWRAAGDSVRTLLGAEATEAAFKRLAPGARLLHVATHGVVVGDRCAERSIAGTRGVGSLGPIASPPTGRKGRRPAAKPAGSLPPVEVEPTPETSPWAGRRVWLALASAEYARDPARDEDDGLLTSEEVMTLDLTAAEWVVLSACHSGLAENWAREGALGMRRAFVLAGARSVIASQWAVDDDATAEWMLALYAARGAGNTRASAALQSACRAVIEARRRSGRGTHPFYWAAFLASGG